MSLRAGLRAIASPASVEEAQIPGSGPDRGTPPSAWTTVQVGGDVVYRGGGPVVNGAGESVGEPVAGGVLAELRPCGPCPNPREGKLTGALWVFSVGACGAYGYAHMAIVDAGCASGEGEILLSSVEGPLELRGGTGMLLIAH